MAMSAEHHKKMSFGTLTGCAPQRRMRSRFWYVTETRMPLHRLGISILALLFAVFSQAALAQAPAQQPASPPAASSDQQLKPEELDALVAPIALYPDTLLSLMLQASTYPLEIVQADRWAKENKNLKGDALKTAVDKQSWDDSVKSLA